jgi:hypothetical protein
MNYAERHFSVLQSLIINAYSEGNEVLINVMELEICALNIFTVVVVVGGVH